MFKTIGDGVYDVLVMLNTGDNGRISHTKVWSNIAYIISSWVIIQLTLDGGISPEYFLMYLGIVASHSAASKWINNRAGKHDISEEYSSRGARKTEEL